MVLGVAKSKPNVMRPIIGFAIDSEPVPVNVLEADKIVYEVPLGAPVGITEMLPPVNVAFVALMLSAVTPATSTCQVPLDIDRLLTVIVPTLVPGARVPPETLTVPV